MIKRFEAFVTGITLCYKYIQKIKSAEMTELGLKGTHVMCIFFLSHNPEGLTAAQLCRLCAEDKAAVSRTVAELQREGYVAPGEKRYRAALRLTEKGMEIAKRVDELIEQWVTFGGAGLSDSDREAFYRALELISNNLKKSGENAE